MKITIQKTKCDTEQAENTKCAERQKTSFPKESVGSADLYKPALNKIMTTYEKNLYMLYDLHASGK